MGALFPDLCLRFLAFGWDAVPCCKGPLRTTNFPPTSQGLWTVPQRLELPTGAKRWLKFSSSSAFFLDTWIWVVDFHPSSGPTTSLVSPTMVLTLPSFFQLSITPLWGPNLPCSQVAKRGEKRGQVSATTRVCLPRSSIKEHVLQEGPPSPSLGDLRRWELVSNSAPSGLVLFPCQMTKSQFYELQQWGLCKQVF